MQFNSTIFLVFLAFVVTAYYHLTPRWRRGMLLLASYTFYWVWSIPYSSLLVLSTLVDWAAARIIDSSEKRSVRNAGLIMSMVANLGVLGLFKYADFFSNSAYSLFGTRPWPELDLILPLGISFYTFQTMSYTIDVYRRVMPARKSMFDVALYVSFFPQLVAGPIVRADELIPQLDCRQSLDWLNIRMGAARVIWGLLKKVYFADAMARLANDAYADPASHSGFSLLMATYAFAVQIYCDFSGYCDIAIGCARMLGIKLPENFDKPYLSCSIREFWRRWHITLSTWLRDYLYIPLGGSRRGSTRTYANLMITMVLGGLWHGAGWNWVVWGGLQGAVMSGERALGLSENAPRSPVARFVRWFITMHIVCVSWVLFRSHGMDTAWLVFSRMFTMAQGVLSVGLMPLVFLLALLAAESADLRNKWMRLLEDRPVLTRWASYGATAVLMVTFVRATNPEFIYFQF